MIESDSWNHPFDIYLNLLVMSKKGWYVGLGQESVAWGRRNKDLKKGDKLGALKKGGGIPLANYGPPCNMSITFGTEDQNAMNIQ